VKMVMRKCFFKKEQWESVFIQDGKEGLDTFLEDKKQWDFSYSDLNLPSYGFGMQICSRNYVKICKKIPLLC